MQLHESGGRITGTMGGAGNDLGGNITITVAGTQGGDATVSGAAGGRSKTFTGDVNGQVTITTDVGSGSCSSSGWTLEP